MCKGRILLGALLILAGILFLLSNVFGYDWYKLVETYWPTALIVLGAWIIIKD